MTDETSQLLSDTAEKLFSDHVTKNCIIDAEKGTWPDELWSEVIANGFNLILVPEELGGVGGNWMNAGILFKASGRYQAPIPLAENIVASYILSLAGISQPTDSILTILNGAFVAENDLLSGSSPRTPFASYSTHGVVLYKDGSDLKIGLVELNKSNIKENYNMALESRGHIDLDKEPIIKSANRPYRLFNKNYFPITNDLPFIEIGIGSWYGKKFQRSGFFRTEFDGNKWWFVTPEGNGFISLGINHYHQDWWAQQYNKNFWLRKFNSKPKRITFDGNYNAKLAKEKYDWRESQIPFERTYRLFSNLDNRYSNGASDLLKFVKFGYGRATDHACEDISCLLYTSPSPRDRQKWRMPSSA